MLQYCYVHKRVNVFYVVVDVLLAFEFDQFLRF